MESVMSKTKSVAAQVTKAAQKPRLVVFPLKSVYRRQKSKYSITRTLLFASKEKPPLVQ
jgi:hypothetical protein